jgi:hypothetical protein
MEVGCFLGNVFQLLEQALLLCGQPLGGAPVRTSQLLVRPLRPRLPAHQQVITVATYTVWGFGWRFSALPYSCRNG